MSQTALITGGSTGLGFEFAKNLGKKGFNIIVLARSNEKNQTAIEELTSLGIRARSFACDVSEEAQVKSVFETLSRESISIDFLILNAGIVLPRQLSDYTDTSMIRRQLDVNLYGVILSTWMFMPLLQKGSKILITSSGYGLMGAAGYSLYCATKAGVINFAESLRRELLCKDIYVYVSCPSDMDTPQLREEIRMKPEWMQSSTPVKMQPTGKVAQKILTLCKGKRKFLIIPVADVFMLAILNKLLPQKLRDLILDNMFPQPKA